VGSSLEDFSTSGAKGSLSALAFEGSAQFEEFVPLEDLFARGFPGKKMHV
jgi:hypothetical protein